jgi:alkylhydroperoxidase family enzyme
MALIPTIPPEKAEGKLAELYAEVEQLFGRVPNNVQLLGVSPAILETQMHMVAYYREHPALRTHLLAMIRMLVSKACKSPYCLNLNTGLLMKSGFTKEQIQAAQADPNQAPLDDKEKALLLFVLKATDNPHSVVQADIDQLRSLGWTDLDIFDGLAQGARMVGTNIIFDTFKVDID